MTVADLVVRGRIVTLAAWVADPLGIVEALAIRHGRVLAAGSWSDVSSLVGPATRRLELAPDEAILPGLTDAHLHLADAAVAAVQLELESAPTLAVALERIHDVHEGLTDPSAWLRGGGWDAGRWGTWPTAADLDRVAPGRRVILWSHDLHAVWVSPAALSVANVTAETDDPPGGLIRRLDGGSPAGVLHEDATGLVTAHAPVLAGPVLDDLIEAYTRRLLSFGITAIHDPSELEMDSTLGKGFAAIERLGAADRLPIGAPLGPAEGRARVGWLKLFGDGTLGSRTAALLAPYEPEPGRGDPPGGPTGVYVTSPEEMTLLAARAATAGITTQIHAIGDRSLRAALDALEPTTGRTALRARVEHVQLVDPADMPRFARAGILASVQPGDLRDDAAKARRAWGPRADTSYPWRSLVRGGAVVAFGTDAPAADDRPWPALAAALTRSDPSWPAGTPALGPQESLTLGEALRAASVAGAEAANETDRGRLVAGHRADMAVVPSDALVDPDVLRAVHPRLVMVDGVVAFEA
jgi:predicted amidohydrolase YtcJ